MTSLNGIDLHYLAETYGTPLYVYSQEQIIENYETLVSTFKKYYSNTHIHYAVKANTNLHILKLFHQLGAGVDCSSPIELMLSNRAGFSSDQILYTGNYESTTDFHAVEEMKPAINLDDVTSLDRLLSVYTPEQLSFRINPGIGRGGFEGIITGGTDAKFGVPYEKALDAYKKAKAAGVKRFGIHMMTGSNNLEPYHFSEVVDKLMTIAGDIFTQLGTQPEYVDIGGGLGIPYSDEEQPLDLERTASLVAEVFKEKCEKYHLGSPKLILEPGRFLVGNAGVILTKVTGTKSSYKDFVGIDAGMNTLIRPTLYGAVHRVTPYKPHATETKRVNLCGQICENSDILADQLELPEVEPGDLLLIHDVGAYGYVMASNYNNRLRPAEVLIENKNPRLIRRRETLQDVLNLYPFSDEL